MRTAVALLMLVGMLAAAHAFGLGEGNRFGRLGFIAKNNGTPAPPSSCDGTIDLSTGCTMPMLR